LKDICAAVGDEMAEYLKPLRPVANKCSGECESASVLKLQTIRQLRENSLWPASRLCWSIVDIRDHVKLHKFANTVSVKRCSSSCVAHSMKTARQIARLIKAQMTAIIDRTTSEVIFDSDEENGIIRGFH
jgi:hypothetical protein